jgi:hypothetical protein
MIKGILERGYLLKKENKRRFGGGSINRFSSFSADKRSKSFDFSSISAVSRSVALAS